MSGGKDREAGQDNESHQGESQGRTKVGSNTVGLGDGRNQAF